jgi:hypothetical protein
VGELTVAYSPRQILVDEAHVRNLLEVVDQLPPLLASSHDLTVVDGVHRLEAHRRAGHSEVEVILVSGDELDICAQAIQANVTHGKPLTRVERRAAATQLLSIAPERSDRWIGGVCGLSHATVGRLRTSFGANATTTDSRVGRDGRRRPLPRKQTVTDLPKGGEAGNQINGGAAVLDLTASDLGRVELTNALEQRPELSELTAWLEQTSVSTRDFEHHLQLVPMGLAYSVVDECRRRSDAWREIASALEDTVRGRGNTNRSSSTNSVQSFEPRLG